MLSVPDSFYVVTSCSKLGIANESRNLCFAIAKAVWLQDSVVTIKCRICHQVFGKLICPHCGKRLKFKSLYTVTKYGLCDNRIKIVVERWECTNQHCPHSVKSHVILPQSLIPELRYPTVVVSLCLKLDQEQYSKLSNEKQRVLKLFKATRPTLLWRWRQKNDLLKLLGKFRTVSLVKTDLECLDQIETMEFKSTKRITVTVITPAQSSGP